MSDTVLVIGSGGREHALAWKLARSPRVGRVIVAPGNPGMFPEWERWPVDLSQHEELERLAAKARAEGVSLAVVGPDNALADGIVDVFQEEGVLVFGPTAAAARIESSKAFSKEVMQAAGVPTASFFVVEGKDAARARLKSLDWTQTGWVVKADGLALGKGVVVCGTLGEALWGLDSLSGERFVIEERLQGEELSWMAFCDGERCALLEPARDHKRLKDGDQGPNTGGMGAFSPVPGVPEGWAEKVRKEVFLPVLAEMKKRDVPFRGVLFAGLMVDVKSEHLWVLEFNARFGDPETQALLPRFVDGPEGDLYTWCEAAAKGDLSGLPERVPFIKKSSLFVVAAARGYPDAPEKGAVISGLPSVPRRAKSASSLSYDAAYFCAGVAETGGQLKVAGGRVLGALGLGRGLSEAHAQAYGRLAKVHFEGMQFRRDIGTSVLGGGKR